MPACGICHFLPSFLRAYCCDWSSDNSTDVVCFIASLFHMFLTTNSHLKIAEPSGQPRLARVARVARVGTALAARTPIAGAVIIPEPQTRRSRRTERSEVAAALALELA